MYRPSVPVAAAVALSLLLSFPASAADAADLRAERVDAEGYSHGPWRSGDALLAGQPEPEAIERLAESGYRLVINLRTPEEMDELDFDHAAVVESAGMTYVHLPLRGSEAYPFTPAAVDALAEVLERHEGPFLLHCASSFRAGQLWGAYLVRHQGVPVDVAFDIGRETGLRVPLEEFLGTRLEVREPLPDHAGSD